MPAPIKRTLPLLLVSLSAALAQPPVLNVSHDLTTLGIATQNMSPDTPDLDSRPLFESALQYAQTHSIPRVTADPGAYYFLTGHSFGAFVFFNGLHDVAIDFAGSDLYVKLGNWNAISCTNCQNVQFLNFTLDSLQLPFTQVRVTSVDTANNRILYAALPGWEAATNFNTVRNPFGAAEPLYAFDFRNGAPVRQTARMSIQKPVDSSFLSVSGSAPWENVKQLASIQPGDIIVLEARAGGPAVVFRGGSNIVIKNVALYFSGQVGVSVDAAPNSTLERVQVIPRPGTDRLVSSNADGISAIQLGQNLTIRGCRVKRTQDDGMSPNSQSLAVVTGQQGARVVTVNRSAYSIFANGLAVQFIDNKTGSPAVTAHITQQDPPYSSALPTFGGAVTLTLDQDIPALALNDPMVYGDPAFRGSGLLLENNLIQDLVWPRGISVWGILGGILRGNVVRNVAWSAINLVQHLSIKDWMVGPLQNVEVRHNVVGQFNSGFGGPFGDDLAGIDIQSADLNLAMITNASPFQNITIVDNFLATGAYSGIRVQNVNGGTVSGNVLLNVSAQPNLGNPSAALLGQLDQPILVTSSNNVSSTGNTISNNASLAAITSAVSYSDDAIAPDSWAAIFGTNLATKTDIASTVPFPTVLDGVTVTITDSAGISHAAQIWFISPGQINFLTPPDCPPGAAVVTVALNGATVAQGGVMID
jgi:hypothetical protein